MTRPESQPRRPLALLADGWEARARLLTENARAEQNEQSARYYAARAAEAQDCATQLREALRAQAEAGMCRTCRHWVPFTENLEVGGCSLLNHAEGTKLAYLNIAGAGAFPEGYACITTRPEFGCTHWEARAALAQAGGEG